MNAKTRICYLCGKDGADSADHVPPKSIFLVKGPDMITAPSHIACNNGWKLEDEYFRMAILNMAWKNSLRKGSQLQAHSGVLGMGIRKEFRSMGIGKQLIQAALADAETKGMERIELTVLDNNQAAIALYLKCGFRVEGKMEKYLKFDGLCYDGLF